MSAADPKTAALIVAAGRGQRFTGSLPKQYADLAGRPVLRHSLETFAYHPRVQDLRVVIHPDDLPLYRAASKGLEVGKHVAGGDSRQDSVRRGLESLAEDAPDLILIHDAARPLLAPEVIDNVLDALEIHSGAIPALPVVDTLKRGHDGLITDTAARQDLWRAQTPQGFHVTDILRAHAAARTSGEALTDDAAVAEAAGLGVALVPGNRENIKVTTQEDLETAELWLAGRAADRETRVGQGFDVHRFGPGSAVILCGVKIPHSAGLKGHSDADVALHAITDALLGGLGAGDIGSHFPPSDPRWRNADSTIFLRHAVELVQRSGGQIRHVDLTLICEGPKIGAHRDAMRARLGELLGLPQTRVSVKATTTERLGFTGRGEGIAAQAIATLSLPRADA